MKNTKTKVHGPTSVQCSANQLSTATRCEEGMVPTPQAKRVSHDSHETLKLHV